MAEGRAYDGPVIDAHHHLWDLSAGRYPWLTGDAGIGALGDIGYMRRDYLPDDYTNPIEAQAIALAVQTRLLDPTFVDENGAGLTLAVITMNAEQQKLVEDMLDRARSADPALEPFFAESAPEPVIVRNLAGRRRLPDQPLRRRRAQLGRGQIPRPGL